MIVDYVKWFCESINVSYKISETLELWIISRENYLEFQISHVHISDNKNKQLTLFDFDIAI